MIDQLLIISSVLIIYEFIRYIQLINIIKFNLKIYQKIFKLFKYKKASGFRKEKLLYSYSKSLFLASVKIIVIFIYIIVFMIILNFLSNSYLNLVISTLGIIEFSIFFLIYYLVREKFYAKL